MGTFWARQRYIYLLCSWAKNPSVFYILTEKKLQSLLWKLKIKLQQQPEGSKAIFLRCFRYSFASPRWNRRCVGLKKCKLVWSMLIWVNINGRWKCPMNNTFIYVKRFYTICKCIYFLIRCGIYMEPKTILYHGMKDKKVLITKCTF